MGKVGGRERGGSFTAWESGKCIQPQFGSISWVVIYHDIMVYALRKCCHGDYNFDFPQLESGMMPSIYM